MRAPSFRAGGLLDRAGLYPVRPIGGSQMTEPSAHRPFREAYRQVRCGTTRKVRGKPRPVSFRTLLAELADSDGGLLLRSVEQAFTFAHHSPLQTPTGGRTTASTTTAGINVPWPRQTSHGLS
jgi:hypothetical protein